MRQKRFLGVSGDESTLSRVESCNQPLKHDNRSHSQLNVESPLAINEVDTLNPAGSFLAVIGRTGQYFSATTSFTATASTLRPVSTSHCNYSGPQEQFCFVTIS